MLMRGTHLASGSVARPGGLRVGVGLLLERPHLKLRKLPLSQNRLVTQDYLEMFIIFQERLDDQMDSITLVKLFEYYFLC